jgi:hypothetical protein
MPVNPYNNLDHVEKEVLDESCCTDSSSQVPKKVMKKTLLSRSISNLTNRIQSTKSVSDSNKSPATKRNMKPARQEIKTSPARTISSIYSLESTTQSEASSSKLQVLDVEFSSATDRQSNMDANEIAIAKAVIAIKFTTPKSNKSSISHVKLVTRLMKRHPTSFRVQHAACVQLFALATEFSAETAHIEPLELHPVHTAMFRRHAIGLIVQAMKTFLSSPQIHPLGLGTLYTLGRYSKGRHYIREEGGLEALAQVHTFYTDRALQFTTDIKLSVEIQKLCCITWANVVASGNQINQELAAKLGAIQLILYSMEVYKHDLNLCQYAAGAIANLGFKHRDNLHLIRQQNGLQILESTLSEVEKQPKSEFAITVRNLVQAALDNLEQDALDLLNGEDPLLCIENVVNLVEVHLHSAKVAAEGARLFWHLSARSGNPKEPSEFTADDTLRDVGALNLLIILLQYHVDNPSVIHLTCGAIWNLTSTNTRNQEVLREAGGLKFLVMVLARYCLCENKGAGSEVSDIDVCSSDVISHALCAISNAVASNSVNQSAMLSAGAIPLIIECMKNYHMEADVQCFSLKSLINLTEGNAENSREVVVCGGLPLILMAMTSHQNHEEIQMCGCMVLTNICFHAKRGFLHELNGSDGLHILRETADKFPSCQVYFSEIERTISF